MLMMMMPMLLIMHAADDDANDHAAVAAASDAAAAADANTDDDAGHVVQVQVYFCATIKVAEHCFQVSKPHYCFSEHIYAWKPNLAKTKFYHIGFYFLQFGCTTCRFHGNAARLK